MSFRRPNHSLPRPPGPTVRAGAGCRDPVRGFPVGLTLSENPIGGFRQVAGGGADGNGVAFAPPGALVEMNDVLAAPVGMVAMADDDVGGFDAPKGMLRERPTSGRCCTASPCVRSGLGQRWR